MPNNGAEFSQLRTALRRQGHIMEGVPGNVSTLLRGPMREARPGAYMAEQSREMPLRRALARNRPILAEINQPRIRETGELPRGKLRQAQSRSLTGQVEEAIGLNPLATLQILEKLTPQIMKKSHGPLPAPILHPIQAKKTCKLPTSANSQRLKPRNRSTCDTAEQRGPGEDSPGDP